MEQGYEKGINNLAESLDEYCPYSPKGRLSREKLIGILATAADSAMAEQVVGSLSPGADDVAKDDFVAWALRYYEGHEDKLEDLKQAIAAWSTWLKLDQIDHRIRSPKKREPPKTE
eukprot:TRINITY_DN12100_c0_g1_i2.p1 TRINITY_DN12100_c0_g1~~TRINITY_DN12100_c0_g1_i2.p1  ORF type:complete len:116 (+),score=33.10 TRINITY_DN12100_c0_g1_i2:144-491(+)